jgi:hypothetical protein
MEITPELKAELETAGIQNIDDLRSATIPAGMAAVDVVRMLKTEKPHLFKPAPEPKHVKLMSDSEYQEAKRKLMDGAIRRSL